MISIGLAVLMAACDGNAPVQPVAPGNPAVVPTVTLPAAQPPAAQPQAPANPSPAQPQPAQPANTAAAIVNGQAIPIGLYQQQYDQFKAALIQQGLDANSPDGQAQLQQMGQLILDNLIDDALIAQEAAKQGVSVSDADLNTAMQQLADSAGGQAAFEQTLTLAGQTMDDARNLQRTQMLNNLMRDRVIASLGAQSDQIHARHILVDSAAAAEALLAQITAGADFGQVAQQSSQDTLTKASGGDLGWFPRGVLISKEVEDAAFNLQPGQISGVIQSAFGFHLVQVLERDANRQPDADQLLKIQQQAVEQWLSGLRAAAQVERLAGQ
ncbi:Foldase protein PrsA 2 [Gammaproteobacteria bacterium]|nr:Foldase protein PrsA 2 [Gammaproteobacteria bacterium]